MRVGFSSRSFINALNLYSGIEAKHLSRLGKKKLNMERRREYCILDLYRKKEHKALIFFPAQTYFFKASESNGSDVRSLTISFSFDN